MFSFNQSKFKRNTKNCWFASSLNMVANNVWKHEISDQVAREIEQKAYDQFTMPKSGLTIKWWIDRISKLTDTRQRTFPFGGILFRKYLNSWYVISCTIEVNDIFIQQRWSGWVITWWDGKNKWGHAICIFKKDGKYYFLNSWSWDNVREIESLDIPNVFKKRENCGVLLPKKQIWSILK